MKIIILTNQTLHHTYFVKKITENFGNVVVYCENYTGKLYSYETIHDFELRRNLFEMDRWSLSEMDQISKFAPTNYYSSLNCEESLRSLKEENADIVIGFGTQLLSRQLLEIFPEKIFNLHGGDTSRYRGLDSHLWAIYHRDFLSLTSTLHYMNHDFDKGNIVMQGDLRITRGMPIEELRSVNTEMCVQMSIALINSSKENHTIPNRKLLHIGRYYSAMPAVLKEICVQNFKGYVNSLK
jgi:methionyl-tRNA formyltransferase